MLLEHVKAEQKWLKDRLSQLGRIRDELEKRLGQARSTASDAAARTGQDTAAGAEAYNPA